MKLEPKLISFEKGHAAVRPWISLWQDRNGRSTEKKTKGNRTEMRHSNSGDGRFLVSDLLERWKLAHSLSTRKTRPPDSGA